MIGRRPGRRPQFTRDAAVDAALAEGVCDATFASVADALGVSRPALYREFDSPEALRLACLRRVGEEMGRVWAGRSHTGWAEALRDVGEVMWQVADRHRGVALAILTTPGASVEAAPALEAIVVDLMRLGLSREVAEFGLDAVGDLVLGTHVAIESLRERHADGRTGFDAYRQRWQASRDAGGSQGFEPTPDWLVRGNLDRKIDVTLAGIAATMPVPPSRTPEAWTASSSPPAGGYPCRT